MRTTTSLLIMVAALLALAFAPTAASPHPPRGQVSIVRIAVDSQQPVLAPTVDARVEQLAAQTLGVMRHWPPAVAFEAVGYDDVAHSLAEAVVNDFDGRGEWAGWPLGKQAVLLAALGYYEGARYAAHVDDGRCNDPAWRSTPEGRRLMLTSGDCDGGRAFSIFQIHPFCLPRKDGDCEQVTGDKLIGSRTYAAGVALWIASRSIDSTGTLQSYTGESGLFHPKADVRLAFALDGWSKYKP